MKKTLLILALFASLGAVQSRADFNPVPLTPGSFTADVIVEKTAPKPINDYVNATMDGGTNNNAWVWYEQGYDATRPTTGIPLAGTTFSSVLDAAHTFKLAADFTTNNAILVTTNGHPNATLTVSSPVAATTISLLYAGGGDSTIAYTINYQGGGTQSGQLAVTDWFNTAITPYAFIAAGRVNMDNGQTGNQFGTQPRMFYSDIFLTDTVNPVVSITFASTSTSRAVIFGLSTSTDAVNYGPVTITGFNRDMVVEATAPLTGSLYTKCNVIMDSGATNLTGNTWYEIGFNKGALTTGVPAQGSNVSGGSPLHTFTMATSYTANNVIYLGNYDGYQSGTFNLSTPTAFAGLSFLNAAGNGPVVANVTVHFADTTTESFSISIADWFNGAAAFYAANGRFNPASLALNDVNSGNPRLRINDIVLANTTSPVTSIDFSYASGGRAMLFGVAGQAVAAGPFSPVAVTGYNADGIVEASAARFPNPLYTATTATMDGGTNNTANTWCERGFYRYFTNAGLPAAGSIIQSLAQSDHYYQLPASYAANNAVFVDSTFTNANLTIASPATYSALSFLSATANGRVTNQCIMQYADGTTETNTFISQDWFNNTPYAYSAHGRVNVDTRTMNADPGRAAAPSNPRLYEAQFALGNTGSPVTNVVLKFLGAQNANGRMFVFAVSATAGAVPPIIASVSVSPTIGFEGTNVVCNALITGGTAPITYQWQKGTNGVYVNISNGGNISGATTTNMVISGATQSDAADYRLVASNVTGSVNSGIATLIRLYSALPDVTATSDVISVLPGTTTPVNESVNHAIDNVIQKYLNWDSDAAAPFVGPVGFTVKPALGNTIVTVLRFYTANDAEGRDPADYVLEGSNDGSTFNPISSGPLALPAGRNTVATDPINPLTQNNQEVRFANTAGYTYLRLSFNNVKDNTGSTSMQIGEVELLGTVNPNPPPIITIAPADVSANEGTTATFTSLASGPGPITYQWYDVTAGDPGTLLSGQTSPNLSLNNVTLSQNGNRYRVIVTNPNGSVTSPAPALPGALLTVNTGPVTVVQDLPAEVQFYAGRTVSLTVGVSGTAPTYQWQSNGVNLVNGGRISGATSNVLTIANLQLGDAASYQLLSSNVLGGPVPSSAAQMYVTVAPSFHTNGVGWNINADNGGGSYFAGNDVLSLTTTAGQRCGAWFTTPMNIDGFTTSFLYQDIGGGGADGFAFVVQNSAQTTNALGGGGGGLGYLGMPSSAAVMFNIYQIPGIAFRINGAAGAPYETNVPVNIASGDPIQINLSYANPTLTLSLSNTVTATTFTTNLTVGNLATAVGTNVAYVGITAATGGVGANQQLSNFQYVPRPTITPTLVGNNLLLAWPATIGGYDVTVSPNLNPGSWSAVPGVINQTGGLNQKVVTPVGDKFYRLALPLP